MRVKQEVKKMDEFISGISKMLLISAIGIFAAIEVLSHILRMLLL